VLVELTAWTFGVVCLVTAGALYIDGVAGARHELERFFVPSVPAPLAEAVYVLSRERVHILDTSSLRPSGPFLAGAQDRKTSWQRCVHR
jgi:hypothetical protein